MVIARCVSFTNYMEAVQWETYDDRWVNSMDATVVYFGEDSQTKLKPKIP
jgi:hypothetical protein